MSEKTVYRISEVLESGRPRAVRLALIHFADMSDEEQRSEIEAVRSLTAINPGRQQRTLKLMEDIVALDPDDRRALASEMREDFLEDTLSGKIY